MGGGDWELSSAKPGWIWSFFPWNYNPRPRSPRHCTARSHHPRNQLSPATRRQRCSENTQSHNQPPPKSPPPPESSHPPKISLPLPPKVSPRHCIPPHRPPLLIAHGGAGASTATSLYTCVLTHPRLYCTASRQAIPSATALLCGRRGQKGTLAQKEEMKGGGVFSLQKPAEGNKAVTFPGLGI